MRFRLLMTLCGVLAAGTGWAQGPDQAVGDWHGVLETPQGELTLIVTIMRDDDALHAELEVPAQAPGRKVPIRDIEVSRDSLTFAIPAIGASYRGSWDGREGRWVGEFTQGISLPLILERGMPPAAPRIEGLDGTWEGTLRRNDVDLRLILRVRTAEGGTIASLDSPDMGASGVPIAGLARQGETVSFAVPAASVEYSARLAEDGARLTGQWTRPGFPTAQVTFVRTAASADRPKRERPQHPEPPFPYLVEEVVFEVERASGVRLAGTLTLPEGPGPFPAAILISGSGPQDRDETIRGHKPFAVLADHLTRRGVAVLRYDDRGFGESTGDHRSATSADFAIDANAAVRYLSGRPEVEPTAIGFIGHSEGGMVAPIAASANDRVAFVVLLAAPGTTTLQLLESQRRLIGLSQGMSEQQLDRAAPVVAALQSAVLDAANAEAARQRVLELLTPSALETLGIPPQSRDLAVWEFTRDWYRYFLRYDPATFLSRITVPVLALNGSLDQQVPADENLAGIARALAHNPDVTIRKLEGLNHLFQTAETGAIGEYADITETFAPVALEAVSDWIVARFGADVGASP